MIGFVVAMEKEASLLLNKIEISNEQVVAGMRIVRGMLNNKDIVLIIAGIGKVNAGMGTQILIDRYNVDTIINFGLAGGKQGCGLKAGDIVQVNKVCQYDFDLSELDNVSVGYMQNYDTVFFPAHICEELTHQFPVVRCATGDRFTSKQIYLDTIHSLGGMVVDMESGAIAQVAYANNTPIYILKLISDVDGTSESIYSQYANNNASICNKIPDAITLLLNHL